MMGLLIVTTIIKTMDLCDMIDKRNERKRERENKQFMITDEEREAARERIRKHNEEVLARLEAA